MIPSSDSRVDVAISDSSDALAVDIEKRDKLARELRKAAEGRERFGDSDRRDFDRAAEIFSQSGYYRVETIKRTQEHPRVFPTASLSKKQTRAIMARFTRLVLGNIETFQMKMKNANGPMIEEVRIPRPMGRWAPSLAQISGLLLHGQKW